MTYDMKSLGWNEAFEASYAPLAERGLTPGRVSGEHRGQIDVLTEDGAIRAMLRGNLQFGLDAPGIGDFVAVRVSDDPGMPHLVEAILPRQTRFVRKAAGRTSEPQLVASNVDVVLIATSLNSDLNFRRIERYLAAVVGGGATPVVVLTKADLVEDVEALAAQVPAEHVVAVSALRNQGLAGLDPWVGPGKTVAVVGMSGVGKSTLINALMGEDVQDTGGIRERDERGKHTTTSRTLLVLPGGGCLIDTPGMRELGLWEGEADLDQVYADIGELSRHCAYRDCKHESEPGCAVLEAIDRGELDPGRLKGYRKLQRELAREQTRLSKYESRQRNRRWGKMIKKSQKIRKKATGRWD